MLEEDKKVSIVVPIYKVQDYIHRCINSILKQTYADLEIILVDDGSPDACGKIADDYGETDPRIYVYHKENGGLSDARNYGMARVTGEYTMFVDSDDWLAPEMVETMVKNCTEYQVDAVQSSFYYAHDDKLFVDRRYFQEDEVPVVLNRKDLMYELIINEKVKNFAWGKLFKTALIRHIPFKKGVLFEDVFWTHQIMHGIDKYLILHQPLYYYYQRNDSIVATYTPRNLDMIRGLKERHLFIETFYPEFIEASYKLIVEMSLIHYNLLTRNKDKGFSHAHRKEIKAYIKANDKQLKKAVKNDRRLRWQLYLFSLHPYLNMGFLAMMKGLRSIRVLPKPKGWEIMDERSGG